ncbi:MAG: hypothetical protein G01um101470_585 [Parcubacteria group bacterium Gr01-1014_70]|nr:MAG: hypothetical protein G01um101470_585 [Parcubacteria group bacterium Gr01-1014_70]
MNRVEITAERALELTRDAAKRIYEIQKEKRQEEKEGVTRILTSLGLRCDSHGPVVPELDDDEHEIAISLADDLIDDESDRYALTDEEIEKLWDKM